MCNVRRIFKPSLLLALVDNSFAMKHLPLRDFLLSALRQILLLLALTSTCNSMAADDQVLHPLAEPRMAPAFRLKDIDGKTHALSDYKGKVIVLNFWATWCPPCRFEMPSMERAQSLTAEDDIVFLGINVGEDEDTIFTFTADYPVTFPLLMDLNSEIIDKYPVVGLPTTYVIDPQGRMVYQAIGTRDWDNINILNQLKSLKP
jgi:peroxiredoxin